MVSSTNFKFKVHRSVSRSKSLLLLLSLLLPNIFYSPVSLFLLTSSCFRNSSSFSKDFIIFMLLLFKSFSCLLNFSKPFTKILIWGIRSSNSFDFRALVRSSLDCVRGRSFTMLSFDFWRNWNNLKLQHQLSRFYSRSELHFYTCFLFPISSR